MMTNGSVLTITLTITLTDVASVGTSLPLVGVTAVKVGVCRSDANRSTQVNVLDLVTVRDFLDQTVTAASAACDVDLSGTIDDDDQDQIRDDLGHSVSPPGLPPGPAKLYTYDGENRLIRVEPVSAQPGSRKVEFEYDYLGRN